MLRDLQIKAPAVPPMRFPQLSAMPASSIREWLDHELELRGIDAVVYTRYILSILQQDNYNLEPQERDLFPSCEKKREYASRKGKGKGKQKVPKMKFTDCEEMKKIAAVECLMSASEQKCGIEELVDELCSRLKSIQCEVGCGTDGKCKSKTLQSNLSPESDVKLDSPEEQAEKYYAAFPALTGKSESILEELTNAKYTSQCNSFWDGKKLISSTSKDQESDSSNENDEQSNYCQASTNDVEIARTTLANPLSSALEPEKCVPLESKPVKHGLKSQHHHHHHHHIHHHHNHHSKSLKSGREHNTGKPSFIVPKCKYRILKQRVPFFKGRTPPFRAPEFKLKRFANIDVKCNLKSACEDFFLSKKVEDNEGAYDSSFEDGDLEEIPVRRHFSKCTPRKSTSAERGAVSENCTDESYSDAPAIQSSSEELVHTPQIKKCGDADDGGSGKESSKGASEETEILQTLEAKFNESLASIWCKHDIAETSFDRLSQMLETAFKTSLSVWFTNLKKSNADDSCLSSVILCADGQAGPQTSAQVILSDATEGATKQPKSNPCDELLIGKAPYSKDNQVMVKNLGSLWRIHDDDDVGDINSLGEVVQKTREECGRIWQCETEKHNFIKGGVYGFEVSKEYRVDGSALTDTADLSERGKAERNGRSPAFDSNMDAFLDGDGGSMLESAAICEEDMKLIWEVLGAIGGREDGQASAIPSPRTGTLPSDDDRLDGGPIPVTDEKENGSVWEQLDRFDAWDIEKEPLNKQWGGSAFPLRAAAAQISSPFKGLSLLWNEAETEKAGKVRSALSTNDDDDDDKNISGIASAFRWGTEESYHQSLWDIWKDNREDEDADGPNTINELSFFSSCNNEEHLSMTRSYDSYLNKEVGEEGVKLEYLSRTEDHVHRSDPVLFGKRSILTYHRGESLFVEVKRQPNNDSVKNLMAKLCVSVDNSAICATSNSSSSSSAAISHLATAINSIVVSYSDSSDSIKKETSLYADGDTFEEENLLTSPKTHFRPIRQLSCESDDTASTGDTTEQANESERNPRNSTDDGVHKAENFNESLKSTSMFTLEDNGILRLRSESVDGEKRSHLYMLYKGQEVSKRPKHIMSAFIPKFKLRSDLEKFCQTEDIETVPENPTDEALLCRDCCGDVHLSEDERSAESCKAEERCRVNRGDLAEASQSSGDVVLELYGTISGFRNASRTSSEDEWDAGVDDAIHTYSSAGLGKDAAAVAFGMGQMNAGSFKELDCVSGSLWSAADEDDSSEANDDDSWPTRADYAAVNDIDEQDFWAITEQTEQKEQMETNELKTMKEEIKKEEEQLFEDIDQMRELDLHNDWDESNEYPGIGMHNTLPETKGKNLKWPIYQEVALDCQDDEDCPELEMINGGQCGTISSSWNPDIDEYAEESEVRDGASSTRLDYSLFKRQDKAGASSTSHHLPIIPISKVIYSSDLEEEWMNHGRPFNIQVPKRSHVKAKIKLHRRPCTFFMDGSCRRTDCKFSHDLASITCRFWEEGSCFKGITCPFLHGYPRKCSPLHKTNKARDFQLESESDFPSLSKSADSTSSGSWMASNVSAKRKKKRNRPRHHSSSLTGNDGEKCKAIELLDP